MNELILDHEAIEAQLQEELHKLETIFSDPDTPFETTNFDTLSPNPYYNNTSSTIHSNMNTPLTSYGINNKVSSVTLSRAEIEESEAEKEALEERVNYLLTTSSQYNVQLNEITQENISLKLLIESLQIDNNNLKKELELEKNKYNELEKEREKEKEKEKERENLNKNDQSLSSLSTENDEKLKDNTYDQLYTKESFEKLEFTLAETRSKLARSLQRIDDLMHQKESLMKQYEEDRIKLLQVEHVRNVYSHAYEESLKHFDKYRNDSEKKIDFLTRELEKYQ